MVRSLARPWRGFGFGVGFGWTERCNTAQCIDANMLSSRAWRELHFSCLPLHGACASMCCMHHASCCMLHGASGAQGEWLDLACGGNLTDFPRGFSSTVCRTCRTLTSMPVTVVLPHLPVIVQLHRQVSSTRPSPHLRRARTLARGLRRAPSPHLPREPSP